jgi:NAD(P)-dependent dehydrogenase (short-subunit alcohol dehydrogenase family)
MGYRPFDLTGKAVVVTGGNGGIGYGMAEALVQAGASVAIWGTNQMKTDEAAHRLAQQATGAKVEALICNVGDSAAVDAAMAKSVAAFGGRLDGCVANAGVIGKAPSFVDMADDEWRRVLAINLDGAFFTLRAATRAMIAAGNGGSLIGIASTAAIEGAARNEQYGASKGGLISMIKGLAVELARHRIRANSILPGWISTDMTTAATENEKFAGAVLPRIPARRWGEAADFGGIAVYLTSDAAAYHTGDSFVIDGGYTIF